MSGEVTAPQPLAAEPPLAEEPSRPGVPVYELDGEVYQQFNQPPPLSQWELSQLWSRHTVSSEAKDWGVIRARQSKPIDTLYQRLKNFDRVPAFKQYPEAQAADAFLRIQKPTRTAEHRSGGQTADSSNQNGERQAKSYDSQQLKGLLERVTRPTTSYTVRRDLTLKYKPKQESARHKAHAGRGSGRDGNLSNGNDADRRTDSDDEL